MSFTKIPNFASIIVHEEVDDLVNVVLLLERSEVLLVEIQQFHLIFVNFFCHNQLEFRVCYFLLGIRQEFALFVCPTEF